MVAAAVTMVRDEADVIESTVRNMCSQVDMVIVADNGSVDGTRDILERLAVELPVEIVDDPDPGYYQSAKMTRLAHMAGDRGAEWVVPFDADEFWYCPGIRVADRLAGFGPGMMVVTAELFDHVATGTDPEDPDPVTRMMWRRQDRLPLPKVACRWRPDLTIHQGNHGCDYDGVLPASLPGLTVRHYPYRSVEQFIRKVRNGAAAYRATDLPDDTGAHWRQWGELLDQCGELAVADVFRKWFWRADPTRRVVIDGERQPALIRDPAPRL